MEGGSMSGDTVLEHIELSELLQFLKAFTDAGGTAADFSRMCSNEHAMRAAVLASRCAETPRGPFEMQPYDEQQIREILKAARVDPQLVEKYASPVEFSRIVARNGRITERALDVLAMHLGLTDGKPRTLHEIGQDLGLTRERVRQIESRLGQDIRNTIANDRPMIIDAVDEWPLSSNLRELLRLLG